jgi:hypothetical protein
MSIFPDTICALQIDGVKSSAAVGIASLIHFLSRCPDPVSVPPELIPIQLASVLQMFIGPQIIFV